MTTPQFDRLLHAAAARRRRTALLPTIALVAALLLLLVSVAILLDARFAFEPGGLVGLDLALFACSVIGFAAVLVVARRHRFDARRAARELEQRAGMADSLLISAVQLAEAGDEGRGELAAMTRQRAEAWVGTMSVKAFDDAQALRRARAACAAALVAAAVVCLWFASPTSPGPAVVARLLHPWGDLPPHTLLRFDVAIAPAAPRLGRPARIDARIDGPSRVVEASVVFVDEQPGWPPRVVVPMSGQEGRFSLAIDSVQSPREFYIQTPRGRSRRHRLAPAPITAIESIELRCDFPGYTGRPPQVRTVSPGGPGEPGATPALRLLEGTRVALTVTASEPMRAATLTLEREPGGAGAGTGVGGKQTLPLSVGRDDPRRATGDFTVEGSAGLTLAVEGALHPGESVRAGRIEAAADRPPAVAWEELEDGELAVPAGWPVELAARANDDVAVEAMELRIDGGASPAAGQAQVEGLHTASTRARWSVDPAALGFKPGQRFTCVVAVRDGRPPAGQGATSSPVVVRVVTDEEYRALAKVRIDPARAAEDWRRVERALARLAARQAELASRAAAAGESASGPGPAELARHAAAARSLAAELARRARPPHLGTADAELATALGRAAEALHEAGDASDALASATAAMLEAASRGAGSSPQADAGAMRRFRASAEALEAARQAVAERARASLASRADGSSGAGAGSAGGRGAAGGLQGPHVPTPWETGDAGTDSEGEPDARSPRAAATTRVERGGGAAGDSRPPATRPTSMTGLPADLQELAEAYFQRLNETGWHTGDRGGR